MINPEQDQSFSQHALLPACITNAQFPQQETRQVIRNCWAILYIKSIFILLIYTKTRFSDVDQINSQL